MEDIKYRVAVRLIIFHTDILPPLHIPLIYRVPGAGVHIHAVRLDVILLLRRVIGRAPGVAAQLNGLGNPLCQDCAGDAVGIGVHHTCDAADMNGGGIAGINLTIYPITCLDVRPAGEPLLVFGLEPAIVVPPRDCIGGDLSGGFWPTQAVGYGDPHGMSDLVTPLDPIIAIVHRHSKIGRLEAAVEISLSVVDSGLITYLAFRAARDIRKCGRIES